ncbi:thioesterase II family protein [Streptomyces sp. CA-111067]|uniref:thioesterase II family protein n=1 Tax=Streptomyces sp. CA-111067 TaxID=3240046 RepID=UPI003D9908A8
MPTTGDRPDKWLVVHRPPGEPRTSLVCVPPAGAGASSFTGWRPLLPADTELVCVELPGRESRFDEPPQTDCREVAARIADRLTARVAPAGGPQLVLLGHSLGALIAYEVARRLTGPARPALLIAAACRAPHRVGMMGGLIGLGDRELVAGLQRFGCDPTGALGDPDVAALFLPPLRADLEMAAAYTAAPQDPLDVPLLALSARQDLTCTEDDVLAWREHTAAAFAHDGFDGGHFFLRERRAEVVSAVFAALELAAPGAGSR